MIEALLQLGLPLLLALAGLIFGTLAERRHFRSLAERERALAHVLVFNGKRPPPGVAGKPFHLVRGSVVISGDYFKTMAAGLRNIFGGRMRAYESLLDRARREAILRMKAEADAQGARYVCGVLFETTSLAPAMVCCEVLAYGTAFCAPPTATA